MEFTAPQELKLSILMQAIESEAICLDPSAINPENIDEVFDANNEDYELQDFINDMRHGGEETGIDRKIWSRHYECEEVAKQMPSGKWVGWTYWYGGGKHGEPESIEWIPEAYFVNVTEEEKVVTVRSFEVAA